MPKIKTRRSFEKLSATELSKTIGKIAAGLTGSGALPTPPVSAAELLNLKRNLDDAIIKADKGGSLATARRNALLAECLVALNKDASYVDINCNDDLALLLSSGYEAVSTNRAQHVLNAPQIIAVENGQSGELRPRIVKDNNSKTFLGRIKQANGSEYGPTISFKNSKSIFFKGLTAGIVYVFQLCAIGGSTGQSDWSDPGTGMAQ